MSLTTQRQFIPSLNIPSHPPPYQSIKAVRAVEKAQNNRLKVSEVVSVFRLIVWGVGEGEEGTGEGVVCNSETLTC